MLFLLKLPLKKQLLFYRSNDLSPQHILIYYVSQKIAYIRRYRLFYDLNIRLFYCPAKLISGSNFN